MLYKNIYSVIFVHDDHAFRVVMSVRCRANARCALRKGGAACQRKALRISLELVRARRESPRTRRNFRLLRTFPNSPVRYNFNKSINP